MVYQGFCCRNMLSLYQPFRQAESYPLCHSFMESTTKSFAFFSLSSTLIPAHILRNCRNLMLLHYFAVCALYSILQKDLMFLLNPVLKLCPILNILHILHILHFLARILSREYFNFHPSHCIPPPSMTFTSNL